MTVAVETLTERMQKTALVEVMCGMDHNSICIPGQGWKCRYARGYVGIGDTGLRSKSHECHLCGCFWALPALAPPEKQICDNCGGPAVATGQTSCFPNLLMVDNFVNPAPWNAKGS